MNRNWLLLEFGKRVAGIIIISLDILLNTRRHVSRPPRLEFWGLKPIATFASGQSHAILSRRTVMRIIKWKLSCEISTVSNALASTRGYAFNAPLLLFRLVRQSAWRVDGDGPQCSTRCDIEGFVIISTEGAVGHLIVGDGNKVEEPSLA